MLVSQAIAGQLKLIDVYSNMLFVGAMPPPSN